MTRDESGEGGQEQTGLTSQEQARSVLERRTAVENLERDDDGFVFTIRRDFPDEQVRDLAADLSLEAGYSLAEYDEATRIGHRQGYRATPDVEG